MLGISSIQSLAVKALVVVGIAIAAFFYGHRVADNAWKASELDLQRKVDAAENALAIAQNAASQATAQQQEKTQVIHDTITKYVDRVITRPVYRNVYLDADGLRLVNGALANKAPDPGQPDATLPGPHAAH